jgi:hypothetical protein
MTKFSWQNGNFLRSSGRRHLFSGNNGSLLRNSGGGKREVVKLIVLFFVGVDLRKMQSRALRSRESTVEIAIGIFDSTESAEQAVKT